LLRESGARFDEADTLTRLGDARHAACELAQARDAWQQALVILDDLQHPDAGQVRAKLARTNDHAPPEPVRVRTRRSHSRASLLDGATSFVVTQRAARSGTVVFKATRKNLGYGPRLWHVSEQPRGHWQQVWRPHEEWPGGWTPPDPSDLVNQARPERNARLPARHEPPEGDDQPSSLSMCCAMVSSTGAGYRRPSPPDGPLARFHGTACRRRD
jgi:hypothetical protein